MLDLFCGRLGWSKAFLARGWQCYGIDLIEPPEIPEGFIFQKRDILTIRPEEYAGDFNFICTSSPCEQFSVHGMKHFHPNPPYPEMGIKLFNHTRELCEAAGVPYVMENVRAAQQFVGNAVHHCGPFYLWGSGVPPILIQGVLKNTRGSGTLITKAILSLPLAERRRERNRLNAAFPTSKKECASLAATIPPELANTVAAYAERLIEQSRINIG